MKKKYFNYFKIIFAFGLIALGGIDYAYAQTHRRTIEKAFEINSDGIVHVENKYGNLNVTTWDKDRVEFVIEIKVTGKSEEKAENILEDITVDFENSLTKVSAITKLESFNNSWWPFNQKHYDFDINYQVKMPVTAQANFKNQYGHIYLDELQGKARIKCDYGELNVGRLFNESNYIDIAYCTNSSIEFIKNGTLKIDYSGIDVKESESIDLDAGYSRVSIKEVGKLSFSSDYGKLTLGTVGSIEGNGDYVGISIEAIEKAGNIDLDYGGLRVDQVRATVERIEVQSDYAAVKLGIASDWSFDFEVETEYAGFKSELELDYLKKIKENNDGYYKGSYGNSTEKGRLYIKSDYGGVKLTQN